MSGFFQEQKAPIRIILIGIGIAVAVMLLLMCVICAVISLTSIFPYSVLPYILLIADAVGAFCGTYFSAAVIRNRGLIIGAIGGFVLFIIHFIAGLSTGETITLLTLLRFIVLMVFGAAGGIAGVNKKEKIRIK